MLIINPPLIVSSFNLIESPADISSTKSGEKEGKCLSSNVAALKDFI